MDDLTTFEERLLKKYLEVLDEDMNIVGLNRETNFKPTSQVLEKMYAEFFDMFESFSSESAEEMMKADDLYESEITDDGLSENEYLDNLRLRYESVYVEESIEMIRNVITYLIFKKDFDNPIIQFVYSNNIESVVDSFKNDEKFSKQIVNHMLDYLIDCQIGKFTYEDKHEIYAANLWLVGLEQNKGFKSLTDYMRDVLSAIYVEVTKKSFESCDSDKARNERLLLSFDSFFTSDSKDYLFEKYGLDVRNERMIANLKKFAERIILSDAYLYALMCEDEEKNQSLYVDESLEELEQKFFEYLDLAIGISDYSLPDNRILRTMIYDYFSKYLFYNHFEKQEAIMNAIEDEDEKVKIIQPVYFLD